MQKFQVGDVRITKVVEIEMPTNLQWLIPEAEPEAVKRHESWLRPHFLVPPKPDADPGDAALMLMAIQTFVIESEDAVIVVDTCVGNDKERDQPFWNQLEIPFLERMSEAGFPPERVDRVLCTHLHVDHVGWNTRLEGDRWVPTFPNARYLFGRIELDHWLEEIGDAPRGFFFDSVRPILDADLVERVEQTDDITGEVRLRPTPGHTPGHVSVEIESRGERAVITGDLLHHPVQCAEPGWSCQFDTDAERACETRRSFLDEMADSPILVLGSHFATPTAGRVVRDGETWRFEV